MVEIYLRDEENHILNSYKAEVIPRIGETIYSVHMGGFKVMSVTHVISDEANSRVSAINPLLWVDIIVEEIQK